MVRIIRLAVLVSLMPVSANNKAHAEPRISGLVPRASGDVGAVNTHGWALQRDPDRIVLKSLDKISLLARVEGKLQETNGQLVASEFPYAAIGNLGNSRFCQT